MPSGARASARWPLPGAAWLRSIVLPLGLSLLCLRSVFHDGYLLQVDISFGPRAWPIGWGAAAPVTALEWAAVHTVGGQAAGKIYAVGALFLVGFGPMVLFRHAAWYAQCAAGFLGAAYQSFTTQADPNDADFRVRALAMPRDIDLSRFDRRPEFRDVRSNDLGAEPKLLDAASRNRAFSRHFSLPR